jgi:hypothetical protein
MAARTGAGFLLVGAEPIRKVVTGSVPPLLPTLPLCYHPADGDDQQAERHRRPEQNLTSVHQACTKTAQL